MQRWMLFFVVLGCSAKPDRDSQCKDAIAHMRMVSAMPMREGDTAMVMGACKMWSDAHIACVDQAKNDSELEPCKKL